MHRFGTKILKTHWVALVIGLPLGLSLLVCAAPLAQANAKTVQPLRSQFHDLYLIQGISALEEGHHVEALEKFKKFIDNAPRGERYADALYLGAKAAVLAGESQLALTYLKDLESLLPEVSDLVGGLRAQSHRQQGDWAMARQQWQKILDAPHTYLHEEARFGIADGLFASGELEAADEAYALARKKHPRSGRAITARFNQGRIAEMQGRVSDAADAYRFISHRYPSHPLHIPAEARLALLEGSSQIERPGFNDRLGKVDRLLSARSLEEAEKAIGVIRAEALSERELEALNYRQAKLFFRQQKYDQAVSLLTELMEQTSSSRWRRVYEGWLARTYSSSGQTQKAMDVHLAILAREGNTRKGRAAHFHAAWLAYNGGKNAQAIGLFGSFIDSYSRDRSVPEAMWYMGWCAYRMGDLTSARSTLRRLRERFSSSQLAQQAYYWEGRIAMRLGEPQEARRLFDKAQEHDFFDYYASLARQRLLELDTDADQFKRAPRVASSDLSFGLAMVQSMRQERREQASERDAASMPPIVKPELPWGASTFDWQGEAGQRALTLIRLGERKAAADIVADLDALPGHDISDVHYARARVLFGLGDYNRTYRIISSVFRSLLRRPSSDQNRNLYRLAYPAAYGDLVNEAAKEFGISPLLVLALMRQESAYDDRARSWASANGLMQIIPRTGKKIAQRLGEEEFYNYGILRDPSVNVRFGAWYLSQLLQKFKGNMALAIGSYNAGPVAMARWVDQRAGTLTDEFVEDIPYRETRHYVKRVLGNLSAYTELYGEGMLAVPEDVPNQYLDNINF